MADGACRRQGALQNAAEIDLHCRLTMWRGRSVLLQSLPICTTYMSVSAAQLQWQTGSDVSSSIGELPVPTFPRSCLMRQSGHLNVEEGGSYPVLREKLWCIKPCM